MKTTWILTALLFVACEKADPVAAALSLNGKTANIITVKPTNSRCPDSLDWIAAGNRYALLIRRTRTAVRISQAEYRKADSVRAESQVKYNSAYNRFAALTNPAPGFLFCRYTLDREGDTLTAVLSPDLRVVWPR